MEGEYTKEIKKTGFYSLLLFIILAVFYFFSDIWNFAGSIPVLKYYVVGPVETFIYSFGPKSFVFSALLIIGVIITIILSLLIARQILKLTKRII